MRAHHAFAITALLGAALAGCTQPPPATTEPDSTEAAMSPADPGVAVVPEAYHTRPEAPEANLDSVAVWAPTPGQAWLLVTAKTGHALHRYDARDGTLIDVIGSEGGELGQFRRPNGIAIVDDLVFVVERDNRRVQVLQLPQLTPLGTVGEDRMRRPYGIAAARSADGYDLFVTDNYETPEETIPPDEELGERVRHFRLRVIDGVVESAHVASFGDIDGEGVLHKVETIALDADRGLLMVAEEVPEENRYKVYTTTGSFTGRTFGDGIIEGEPEGLALMECGTEGYWIATDQYDEISRFHVFARDDFEHLGAFIGEDTAQTDGIVLSPLEVEGIGPGLLAGSNRDRSVSVFAWESIAMALGLRADCSAF